ncbi:IMP cyclohydrolase [Methanocella sp. CWC-04]|uniref:IMP cyclohydrolase n=1 Tax=Methanooceanicella nereidis TaxID=2052831 RepID=A0AAP2REQ2_9EURY|nr:IMP cyclohydrolase [Methanocella sp. CWC-04]MCD1295959.1 IMP cyclohydrolase [Methanocella sp. CWC-04]
MYVGRFVIIGKTNGKLWAGYRVSSRSFPNRYAVRSNDMTVAIMPRDVKDLEKSPYISYNTIKILPTAAVVTNGSHTDPIVEKIAMGYPARDALALTLLAMDYEKDALNTPRIAAVVTKDSGFLGIVTKDGISVSELPLQDGDCYMVATYEKTTFSKVTLEATSADDLARKMYDLTFEKPVCSAAAYQKDGGFELGTYNGPQ